MPACLDPWAHQASEWLCLQHEQLIDKFTDVPDHISLWGLLLAIRGPLQLFANVRPLRSFPGSKSPLANPPPEGIDWALVRENSEGEYSGHG